VENGKTWNILMVGVGGQGIVTSSDILTRAAMEAGQDAKKSEIHGMSQRGGSVFSHIRFGPRISSPVIPEGGADILFSLEQLETLRWLAYASADSTVICASAQISPAGVESYPSGVLEEIRRAAVYTVRSLSFYTIGHATDDEWQQVVNLRRLMRMSQPQQTLAAVGAAFSRVGQAITAGRSAKPSRWPVGSHQARGPL